MHTKRDKIILVSCVITKHTLNILCIVLHFNVFKNICRDDLNKEFRVAVIVVCKTTHTYVSKTLYLTLASLKKRGKFF